MTKSKAGILPQARHSRAGGNPVESPAMQPAVYILASQRNGILYTGVTY
jgi:hypothetical protein